MQKQINIISKLLKLNPFIKEEDLNYRSTGKIEWICSHGVGHTIYSPDNDYIHGCCGNIIKNEMIGCCSHLKLIKEDKLAEKRKNYIEITTQTNDNCETETNIRLISATDIEIEHAKDDAIYILAKDVSKVLKKKPIKLIEF